MIRNSLRLKTIIGVAAIEAVLLFLLIVLMLGYIRDTNFDALETRATTTARLFATTTKDAVLAYDLASLNAFVDEVMKNQDLEYARVLNAEGLVMAASEGAEEQSPAQDSSIATVDDSIFDTGANISEGGVVYGRVEVGFRIDPILEIVEQAKRWSLGIAGLEMILVALFSWILGRYLTNKLAELRKAAEEVGEGNLGLQIPVSGEDEIDVVAKAFNEMSQSVESSHQRMNALTQELKQLNETLEEKVQRRTEQLEQRNSELSDANASIKAAQSRLLQTEKSAMVGVLTAGVAHEINNPLGFVMSNMKSLSGYIQTYEQLSEQLIELQRTEQLLSKSELENLLKKADYEFVSEDLNALIEETRDGLERMRVIVDKLGALSSGQVGDTLVEVELGPVITDTLTRYREDHHERMMFQTELDGLPPIRSSHRLLTEIFHSLFENALQACHNQGTIQIQGSQEGDLVIVRVTDSGPGIPPEHQSRIFDPFYTTRDVGSGTGLGLYRVRMLLEATGASIELLQTSATADQTGASFMLIFPVMGSATHISPR